MERDQKKKGLVKDQKEGMAGKKGKGMVKEIKVEKGIQKELGEKMEMEKRRKTEQEEREKGKGMMKWGMEKDLLQFDLN